MQQFAQCSQCFILRHDISIHTMSRTPLTHPLCANVLVAICQGRHAIVQDISFIVKGIQACFSNFDCSQDVIGGKEGSESAGGGL